MSIFDNVLHLWAVPPVGLQLQCPPPPAGVSANPIGYYDDGLVREAFNATALWSGALVVSAILVCYLLTRKSSGPRFDRRWLVTLSVTGILCAAVAFAILHFAHVTAMAQSCQSDPSAFPVQLPGGVILSRAAAGLFWGLLQFAIGSTVFTLAFGWYPSLHNGFYHSRGTPWPRFLPGGK